MAGVLGIGGDLGRWTEEELAEVRRWVALYKETRPLVQRGDLYRLRPPTGGLGAVQYSLGDETVVIAWLQAQRYGEPAPALRLRGLDPTASYACPETGEVHRGAVLLHHGLRTGLTGDLDATVLRLRRIRAPTALAAGVFLDRRTFESGSCHRSSTPAYGRVSHTPR